MQYKARPIDFCDGRWPDGPFTTPPGAPAAPDLAKAAQVVAGIVASLVRRRTARSWSQAVLARRIGLGAHTVGRIEAGLAWPDLATVAVLAGELGLELSVAPPRKQAPQPEPSAAAPVTAAAPAIDPPMSGPMAVDLTGLAEPTAAHVIEAILHNSPRMAGQVESLKRQRERRQRRQSPHRSRGPDGPLAFE